MKKILLLYHAFALITILSSLFAIGSAIAQAPEQERLWIALEEDNTTDILKAVQDGALLELRDTDTGEIPVIYLVTHSSPDVVQSVLQAQPLLLTSFRDPLLSISLLTWSFLALFPQETNLLLDVLAKRNKNSSLNYIEHTIEYTLQLHGRDRFVMCFNLWLQTHPNKQPQQELDKLFEEAYELFTRHTIVISYKKIVSTYYHQEKAPKDPIGLESVVEKLEKMHNMQQSLWLGLRKNNPISVFYALKNGAYLDKPNFKGEIPFVYLATHCKLSFLKVLTDARLSLAYTDPDGITLAQWSLRALFHHVTNFNLRMQQRPSIKRIGMPTDSALGRFELVLKSTMRNRDIDFFLLLQTLFKEALSYYDQTYCADYRIWAQHVIKVLLKYGFRPPTVELQVLCDKINSDTKLMGSFDLPSDSTNTANHIVLPLLAAINEKNSIKVRIILREYPELLINYNDTWEQSLLKKLLDMQDTDLTNFLLAMIANKKDRKQLLTALLAEYWQTLVTNPTPNPCTLLNYIRFFSNFASISSPIMSHFETAYEGALDDWLKFPHLKPQWAAVFKHLLTARIGTEHATSIRLLVEAHKLKSSYVKILLSHFLLPELEQQIIQRPSIVYMPIEGITPTTTPLDVALSSNSAKMVELLLRYGAQPFTKLEEIRVLIRSLRNPIQAATTKKEFTERVLRYLQALRGQAVREAKQEKTSLCYLPRLPDELLVHISSFVTGWEIIYKKPAP